MREEGEKKTERLPSSNEVEKKDKWVRRNVHFLKNDDVEQKSKEQDGYNGNDDEHNDGRWNIEKSWNEKLSFNVNE